MKINTPFIITVGGVDVTVTRKKVKNLTLTIKPPEGAVLATMPERMTIAEVRGFIGAKLVWIKKHQERFAAPVDTESSLRSGDGVMVWGRTVPLEIIEWEKPETHIETVGVGRHRAETGFNGASLILYTKKGCAAVDRESALLEWHRELLLDYIKRKAPELEERTGLRACEWRVRQMKTRWGSCNTGTGRIWLNARLSMLNEECVEYVMIHELCHLAEPAHNESFWALVSRFVPSWKDIRRDMREQSRILR